MSTSMNTIVEAIELMPILTDVHLIQKVQAELAKRIVNEEKSRLCLFLVMKGGQLVENAAPTSSNLIVNDESGCGKDFLVSGVADLLKSEAMIKRVRISATTLTYWHDSAREPSWTWDGKTLYLEDISNSVLNSEVFKVMASKKGKTISTITINNIARDIETNGKPALVCTIASANLQAETLRRFPILTLDSSEKQTRAILDRTAEFEMGQIQEYDMVVIRALNALKKVKVSVPFADKISAITPSTRVIFRTNFKRFVDYVKFSAAIHQFQRELGPDGAIVATKDDYEVARQAIEPTLSNKYSVPLTKTQKHIIDVLSNLPRLFYSVKELIPNFAFSERTLYDELPVLSSYGLVARNFEKRLYSDKQITLYQIEEKTSFVLPTWSELQNSSIGSIPSKGSNGSNGSNGQVVVDYKEKQLKELNLLNLETVPTSPKKDELMLLFGENAELCRTKVPQEMEPVVEICIVRGDLYEVRPGILRRLV